ncbi:MAG: hypothetical protein RBR21_01965 [Bacteroidales bacterium]|nr:hypothetical protein [Bacteroidales bacterium]
MTLSILIGTSKGLLPLAAAAGILYAIILYRKNKIEGLALWQHLLLFVLRMVSVSTIAFLLFNPLMQQITKSVQKPVLVLAHDNSQSIAALRDSLYYKTEWEKQWVTFGKHLEAQYTVRNFLFGESVSEGTSPQYGDYYTDISMLCTDLSRRFSGRNMAAVVLASDGIMNRGIDPARAYALDAPLFAVALGDTTRKTDRYIRRLLTNTYTYLNNVFPVEVEVGAVLSHSVPMSVSVYHNGKRLYSETLTPDSQRFFHTLTFTVEAMEVGLQRFSVRISASEKEENIQNNSRDFYINVLDSRKKIALLSSVVSPDISALMKAITALNTYEIDYYDLNSDRAPSLESYHILILYGIPPHDLLIKKIQESALPLFLIFTTADEAAGFNALAAGVQIVNKASDYSLSFPVINDAFSAFTIPPAFSDIADQLPPLSVPFAEFLQSAGNSVLLNQKIGNVITEMPLLSLTKTPDSRQCLLMGDGFWKWRMAAARMTDNTAAFDRLIARILQYLSIMEEKKFFVVEAADRFYENEPVEFTAEVYNDNFELTNTPDVALVITNERGETFPFSMIPGEKGYSLDAGMLVPGRYTYTATVVRNNTRTNAFGAFIVAARDIELSLLVANHSLLFDLATKNGGSVFYPDQMNRLQEVLAQDTVTKPVIYYREFFRSLVHDPRLFFFILLLLSVEWFLRRYAGSY